MKNLVVYIHGKGGTAEEAKHFEPLFPHSAVVGFDYKSQSPWKAKEEFAEFYDLNSKGYESVVLVANSIGAFFAMNALAEKNISKALFISPVVDMERLIVDMMLRASVTEDELRSKQEIATDFGEVLSWEYLCYVRNHPIEWNIPTCILYGANDNLTTKEAINRFSERIGANLTIMNDGEHWFHTDKQLDFLDAWIKKSI